MAKVLIIGASKGIGQEAIRQSLAAGHTVAAFSRSATQTPIYHPALTKTDGDALDKQAVRNAIDGVDVVIQSLGISLNARTVIHPVTLFSKATRVLVDAMADAGVKRLICVTGFGAGDSADKGGLLFQALARQGILKQAYDDKDVQEWIIRNSDLDWTIARPGLLTNGPHTGHYRILSEPKEWRTGKISRANVADFLVKEIDRSADFAKTPVLVE